MRMQEAVEAKAAAGRWAVATCRSHSETWAKENLERQNFETYLPLMIQAGKPTATNPKPGPVVKPFLPGFIFVRLNPSVDRWRALFSTRGLKTVLMAGERPALIADAEVNKIRCREEGGFIKLLRADDAPKRFERGQSVKINDYGAFHGFDALFEEYVDKDRCLVLVNVFGRLTGVRCTPLTLT